MLALSRSTRQAKGVFRHVRTLSTIPPNASSSDTGVLEKAPDTPFLKTTAKRKLRKQLADSSAECMFVYPWNGIRSSAQGLAIARAVEEKYGPAKEVIFPRDADSVTVFQPYFWLVYDNADARKRLTESTQIRVHIADLPKRDGGVGVEDLVRALELSTDQEASRVPPPPAEGKDEGSAAEGFKALDVRVEWSRYTPSELLRSRRPHRASLHDGAIPDFAAAWLAFDGFSPDAARGAHTPSLTRVREKWRLLAPDVDDLGNESVSGLSAEPEPEPAEVEVAVEADMNDVPSEWIPITPQSPSSTIISKSDVDVAPSATVPSAATPSSSPDSATTEIPIDPKKLSRRKRILHLARQNAEIPLPELPKQPQAMAEGENPLESEQEAKVRTIRERLWRLIGRNH